MDNETQVRFEGTLKMSSGDDDEEPIEEGEPGEEEERFVSSRQTAPAKAGNRRLGTRGERAAAVYLEHAGFEILERNWTCPYGEADLIAREDDDIVFVEVKTRNGIDKGLPEDSVGPRKRSRYEKIAACYLGEHDFTDCYVRFDVIGILVVDGSHDKGRALLRHHRNAFAQGD